MSLNALCIAGATASGKSDLALRLAEQTGGVIINADSMQIYKELEILTARPPQEDLDRAEHRLYGHVSGHQDYSVADWVSEAEAQYKDARNAGCLAIFVGGTGLYFKAAVTGLAYIPDISETVRRQVRTMVTELGSEAAHAELLVHDPVMAERLNPGDSQRVARALEVILQTGRSLSLWQKATKPGFLSSEFAAGRAFGIVLDWPRDVLYARADQRFVQMVDGGGLQEIEALVDAQIPNDRPIMKSLGVPSLIAARQGHLTMEEAIAAAQQQTRRFIKRQSTWFRNQFFEWDRLQAGDSEIYANKVETILQKYH